MIEKCVLHLDPNEFVGENGKGNIKDRKKGKTRGRKRKKKKERGRKGGPASTGLQCSNIERFDGSRSELVCAPRGRVSLLLWLFFV